MPINRVWRPFTEVGIKSAPEKAGVYELGNIRKRVGYIGSSKSSVRQRLADHKKELRCADIKHFRCMTVTPSHHAKDTERQLCNLFKKRNKNKLPPLQKRSPSKPAPKYLWELAFED